jgi:serine/threonine-protein kinase
MEELSGGRSCPLCGYKPETSHDPNYLKPGTVLMSRYVVGALLRKNGESGQYIGFDNNLQRKVWIREYFPYTLAKRDLTTGDVLPQEGCGAQFKALLSDFKEVCAAVRKLGASEAVIPIENVAGAHNTMYAVYRYLPVVSLETRLAQEGGKLSVSRAIDILQPLFGMVGNIHRAGEIHRGISPFTVYVDDTGKLFLGDFLLPAARTGGSELEAELFNGYTAPEQYATNGWQGAWTDVYALAALFYRMVSGSVPPKATLVNAARPLPRLADMIPKFPRQISDAVDAALRFDYEERTQTVQGFLAGLAKPPEDTGGNTAVFDTNALVEAAGTGNREKSRRNARDTQPPDDYEYEDSDSDKRRSSGTFKFLALAMLLTVGVLFAFLYFVATTLNIIPGSGSSSVQASASVSGPGSSGEPSASAPVSGSQESSDPADSSSGESPEEADRTVPRFYGLVAAEIVADGQYEDRFQFELREQFNSSFEEGVVYEQRPVEGTPMPNKGTVILFVSKGPTRLEMPDLTGMDIEEAMKTLYELEQELDAKLPMEVYDLYAPEAEVGKIVRTEPPAGEEFFPDTNTIQVHVAIPPDVSESVELPAPASSRPRQPSSSDDDD